MLIPILIIALTGNHSSLVKFNFFDTKKVGTKVGFGHIQPATKRKPAEIVIFKITKLTEVESVNFPFLEDVADHYSIKYLRS